MGMYNPKFGTDDEVIERVLNWASNPKVQKEIIGIRICPSDCEHLALKEKKQIYGFQKHLCKRYGQNVYHKGVHPLLIKLEECTVYDKLKTEELCPGNSKQYYKLWKLPFEIIGVLFMFVFFGPNATARMIQSETKYKKRIYTEVSKKEIYKKLNKIKEIV